MIAVIFQAMAGKRPLCRLSLVWVLILLMTAETATAEVAVSRVVAVAPTQYGKIYTSSTAEKDRKSVEKRTFPTLAVDQAVRNELHPFAGTLISKDVIDVFHKKNFMVEAMPNFDKMLEANAIDELTSLPDHHFDLLVSWFGTKSPEDQEVVLDHLVAQLRENSRIRYDLLKFIEACKARANNGFRVIASAVEKKWLMRISTHEMYDVLGLAYIQNDEEFVRHVGHLIWNKFQIFGKKEFDSFMLIKMQERSEDDIMWARLIYKLGKDKTVKIPLSGVFDDLLQTKSVAAGYCTPTDAARILTSPELVEVYNDVERTSKEVGAAVVEKLLTLSKDELMWAKLIYILQNDETVPSIPSSVFDYLLQPYEIIVHGEDLCKPSQAVKYLTGPEFSRIDNRLFTGHEFDAQVLAELLKKSHDELMWAKLLFMLRNDKTVSTPFSGVLKTIISSWTEKPMYKSAAIAEESPFSISKKILMDPNFYELHLYAQFSSDNPDVFVLERLRERSADEFMWAQALSALRKDHNVLTPLSGVLDALLHSWIGKPYNLATSFKRDLALIRAYEFLLKRAVTFQNRLVPTPFQEGKALVEVLFKWSKDELMWAKFLFKLQHDEAFAAVASSAFDFLLQSNKAADAAQSYSPTSMAKYLTSSSFSEYNTNAKLLSPLLKTQSSDQVMWSKVFYILQNGESESNTLCSRLLRTLLVYWTHGVAGVTISSNPLVESKSYLESQSFANLIAYARFSSDVPDAFVVEKLRERSSNDFMWARLLNALRKEYIERHEAGHQLRKEDYALSSVLSALLHSWIGKPYDATAVSKDKGILIAAYDYLTSQELANQYKDITKAAGSENANKAILTQLLQLSTDDVMWAKFLKKLMEDSTVGIPISGLFQTLLQSWKG